MRRLALIAPAIALLLTGCSGAPPVTPVEGTVSFSTKRPLANLLIQFSPAEKTGQKLIGGTAITDEAGKFKVKSDDGREGLPAGKYFVTVFDNNLAVDDDKAKNLTSRVSEVYGTIGTENPLKVITVEPGKTTGYDLKLD